MTFHDVRLSDDVEKGAIGGPRFKTTVLTLESGFEKRNVDWSEDKGQWDVGYGLMSKTGSGPAEAFIDEINSFFRARRGRAHSFRFKDWGDFTIEDPNDPTTTNQLIGTGDGANKVFQIFKRYTSGGINYDRPLTKIVSGTLTVLLDGVVQADPADFSVDLITGIVTFVVAPPGGEVVAVACEFDVHVRFNIDHLQINLEIFNAGSVPQIEIVELRGAV